MYDTIKLIILINKWDIPYFIFFHINGSYHSKDYEGIYYYLKKNNTKLKILSIGCEEQKDIKKLKPGHNLADFIIVTPNNMIKTY